MANKWLDPLSYPSQEQFQRAYNQYYEKAKAFQELLDFLAGQEQRMKDLAKKIEAPETSFSI